MKQRTKVLSVTMAVLLVIGTILSPLGICVNAQTDTDTSEYRISLDIQQMGQGRVTFPFGYKNYNCETNDTQIIASKDYTNVITYCADADGYLRVDDLSIELKGTSTEREVEFAVVDDAGVILTNHGQVVTVNSEDAKKDGLGVDAFEVKQGENLHFVFHGVVASGNSMRLATKIMFSSDGETWVQKNSTGKLWASTNTNTSATQGEEGFYYNYSTTYVKEEIKQDSVGIVYKEMTGKLENKDGVILYPFSHSNYHCMTNVPEIIVSEGFTNVIAYEMPSDGQIKLESLKVSIANDYTKDNKEREFEFAVIDSTGKVLSNNGKIAVVNSPNTTDATVSGMSVEALELKAGEKLYFVFHGTKGSTSSLRCSANIMLSTDGTTWSQASQYLRSGEYLLWPANTTAATAEQGKDNFYYGYSETYVTHEYTAPSTQEPDDSDNTQNPTQPTTPTVPGTATVPEANADGHMPTYKINLDLADMVKSTVHKDFPLAMPDKAWHCMTNPIGNLIVSSGYANVITYQVQKAGSITLKNMTAIMNSSTAVVLFAVTDKEGNIIYPADETFVVLDKDNKSVTGTFLQDYKVAIGDEIRFVFEGVEGTTTNCKIQGIMVQHDSEGTETRLTREAGGCISPVSGSTEQGADGFHYQYAKTFENVQTGHVTPPEPEVIPGTATVPIKNAQGLVPKYKINFEAADMVASTVHKNFPLSMPEKEYDCMTNPSGNQIVSKGYANILTYTAQKTGKLTLKNMTAAISVTNAPENVVLFAITDKDGNVLYPSDGTMVVLNKDNESVTGTFLSQFEVKKGDELNFIFQGVEGKTIACRVRGIMLYIDSEGKETRLTREDGGYIAPISGSTAQGADGFSYRYAKKFENVILGYVAPKSKAVQWGEGIQVVVSNNPDDFVYYDTSSDGEATETVDMLEIIKPGVELRYKFIPWVIVAVSVVVFGTQWVVFLIKRRKGVKQNEENS